MTRREGGSAAAAFAPHDAYAVLGVPRTASPAELKQAYHSLSRKLHPDKDRSVPSDVATSRFQRLKAAYELLSNSVQRDALDGSVIIAPPRPNYKYAAQTMKRRAAAGWARGSAKAPLQGKAAARPDEVVSEAKRGRPSEVEASPVVEVVSEAKRGRPSEVEASPVAGSCEACDPDDNVVEIVAPQRIGEPQHLPQVLVIDSDDEGTAQERERQAAAALQRQRARGHARRTEEQAGLLRERETFTGTTATAGPAQPFLRTRTSYVRLTFRNCAGDGTPTAAELEAAFTAFAARTVLVSPENAVLAVAGEERAVECLLAFHEWPDLNLPEATQSVFRKISVLVAPVTGDGRARVGSKTTVAATMRKVAACDESGTTFL